MNPETTSNWLELAVSYPNIILGIAMGFTLAVYTFHKGWITLPSMNKKITDLQIENARLTQHIKELEKDVAEASTFKEFKDKIVAKKLDGILGVA